MQVGYFIDKAAEPQTKGDNVGTVLRRLIAEEEGAKVFSMRLITIDPDGKIGLHEHPWEHEIFVVRGKGRVFTEGKTEDLSPGNYVWIPPSEKHGFENVDSEPLEFVCCIPLKQ